MQPLVGISGRAGRMVEIPPKRGGTEIAKPISVARFTTISVPPAFRAQIHPAATAHVRRFQSSMVGIPVSSDGILVDFCDAYDGSIAWNGYFDPFYFNEWLLPGVPVPPHVLMRCQQCRLVRSAMDAVRKRCPRCSA